MMGQQTVDIGQGQRKVISEQPNPTAAPAIPFDQSTQPPLGGLAAMAGRNRMPQRQPGTVGNPMNFPGINEAIQARLSDPNLTEEQRMMIMLLLRQEQRR